MNPSFPGGTPRTMIRIGTAMTGAIDISHLTPHDPEYWTAIRKEVKAEWPDVDPAPLHTSRDPWPEGFVTPLAVNKLAYALEEQFFTTRLTYARGFVRAVKIGEYREVQSVAVRFEGHGQRGYAIYRTPVARKAWTWDGIGISRSKGFPFHQASRTDLDAWIQVRGSVLPSWFDAITKRVSDQKERQKVSAKERGTKPRESAG